MREASMRPRRIRLGCLSKPENRPVRALSFNEAEAHTPRMQEQQHSADRHYRRFNEAEAHTPRMRNVGRDWSARIEALQ